MERTKLGNTLAWIITHAHMHFLQGLRLKKVLQGSASFCNINAIPHNLTKRTVNLRMLFLKLTQTLTTWKPGWAERQFHFPRSLSGPETLSFLTEGRGLVWNIQTPIVPHLLQPFKLVSVILEHSVHYVGALIVAHHVVAHHILQQDLQDLSEIVCLEVKKNGLGLQELSQVHQAETKQNMFQDFIQLLGQTCAEKARTHEVCSTGWLPGFLSYKWWA